MNHLQDFLLYLASEKGASQATLEAYQRDIQSFLIENECVNRVSELTLQNYIALLNQKQYATSSIRRSIMALKSFFRFLKRENVISKNPLRYLPSPKQWQIIPDTLSKLELENILQIPDTKSEKGARDLAILELLYSSGLRVSELCSLEVGDIQDNFLRVMGKGSKERLVPLGQKALKAILHYLTHFRKSYQEKHVLLFQSKGKPISRESVWLMVKRYAMKAGIKKKLSPHSFRHTFATHLLENGADIRVIQEMLGHTHISSTDRYTQISSKHLVDAFEKFHPRK